MSKLLNELLKWTTALLGLWLIIEISVFGAVAALWIAFATAIAITLVGVIDFGVAIARRDSLAAVGAIATVLLAAFLIVASLVFHDASRSWLMATAGGVTEVLALGGLALSREGIVAAAGSGSREGFRRAA